MKLELNEEKAPFCFIGDLSFTFNDPMHDVDIKQISDQLKMQILYNLRRGVLRTEDKVAFKRLVNEIQPRTPIPVEQIPLKPKQVSQVAHKSIEDHMTEDTKMLRALLRKTITTVKKEAVAYSPSRLQKLLELEKETKNRKKIVKFVEGLIEKHQRSVLESIGPDDSLKEKAIDPFTVDPFRSTQITDVVESEEEQVVFPQGIIDDLKE